MTAPPLAVIEREAERVGVTPGPARAAWVLSRWDDHVDGDAVVFPGGSNWRCGSCGREGGDHGPVRVMLPDQSSDYGAAGVMTERLCPPCAVDRVRGGER